MPNRDALASNQNYAKAIPDLVDLSPIDFERACTKSLPKVKSLRIRNEHKPHTKRLDT